MRHANPPRESISRYSTPLLPSDPNLGLSDEKRAPENGRPPTYDPHAPKVAGWGGTRFPIDCGPLEYQSVPATDTGPGRPSIHHTKQTEIIP